MKNVFAGITVPMLLAASASFAQAPAPAPATSGAPSEPQIAEIVVTVNNGEINEAKLAKSRTKNKEVKNFAQQMITDHTAANKKTAALASKMKIKPEESAESKQLKEEGKEELKKLKGLKGDDFDKEYMESQVRDHQKALDTIDNSLLPNAKDAALKDLLTQTRSTVAMHLDNAKKVQAAMK